MRTEVRYRGWSARPFIRRTPVNIGSCKLYCVGPLGIFRFKI